MRNLLPVLVLGLTSATAAAATPWEQYLATPTPANADAVTKITYSPGTLEHPEYGYDALDLELLKTQVAAGDVAAFRLAVRLSRAADGGLAEDLTLIVASMIRSHPAAFLRELSKLAPADAELESMLLMTGAEYVDRVSAHTYELTQRRLAIANVRDEALKGFKRSCLAVLDHGI
jgi:hypothetical protein